MTVTKSQSSKHSQEKNKESGRKWDGISRPSNDLYKKNYNEIFKKLTDDNAEQIVHDTSADEVE